MLDRLRTLLGKGDRTPPLIPFADLPRYIKEKEDEERGHLEEEVTARRPQVASALEELQRILDALSEAKRTPSSHPKLEKIAQSSLPHFIRSIQQHINRPLPSDVEEYYRELSVLLKGCITAMKGAGKYLPAVFPEEMKDLRHQIGIIGRTLNELTAIFSHTKEKRAQLAVLRTQWDEIHTLQGEQKDRFDRITALQTQFHELERERTGINQSLTDLQRGEEYSVLVEELEDLTQLENAVQRTKLQKEQALAIVLSVCRRAARIARHQNNRENEKMLEAIVDLMESSGHNCEEIRKELGETVPRVMEMIQIGALTLKGQDEQRMFSGIEYVSKEVFQSCLDIRSATIKLEEARQRIQEMPVNARILHLKGEESRVVHSMEKMRLEVQEHETALKELPNRVQTLTGNLIRKVPDILQLECSMPIPVPKESED